MRFIDTFDIERMARAAHSAGIHLADSREDWLKLMMSMAGGGERLLDSDGHQSASFFVASILTAIRVLAATS